LSRYTPACQGVGRYASVLSALSKKQGENIRQRSVTLAGNFTGEASVFLLVHRIFFTLTFAAYFWGSSSKMCLFSRIFNCKIMIV